MGRREFRSRGEEEYSWGDERRGSVQQEEKEILYTADVGNNLCSVFNSNVVK